MSRPRHQGWDDVYDAVVVGGGPHATYALERLAWAAETLAPPRGLRIAVVDRDGAFGCGAVHAWDQAPTSYLNRAAGDVALGLGSGPMPDFHAWQEREVAAGRLDAALGRGDTPERALHGRALAAAFASHAARLEQAGGGEVARVPGEAVAIAPAGEGPDAPLVVTVEGRSPVRLATRAALLATGHDRIAPDETESAYAAFAQARAGLAYVHDPYPLAALDDAFEPAGATVALLGLGLSAIDVVLHLTEGRGGGFERDASGRLRYRAGGREPRRIVGVSPSGRPVLARARDVRAARGAPPHEAYALSIDAVARLRARRGRWTTLPGRGETAQLDFDRDVLPLVLAEMACVHHAAAAPDAVGSALRASLPTVLARYLDAPAASAGEASAALLAAVDEAARAGGSTRRLDGLALMEGALPPGDGDWAARTRAAIADDLARARVGNLDDPLKAAIDAAWRELRPALAAALDFGGLTAASQERFGRVRLRAYNRLSNGSAVEPMEKLLAVAEAGILDLSAGPGARVELDPERGRFAVIGPRTGCRVAADVVIGARVRRFDPRRSRAPLYRALLDRGLVTQWENPGADGEPGYRPGAIAIDPRHHALDARGRPDPRLTLVGSPVDGVRYFQESLARPGASGGVAGVLGAWAQAVVGRAGGGAGGLTGG
ncbi:FAD/NAD(P)-binding protein [Salinarimonas sp.]|uniref:FAD/NAD(P)-binding protein n=1 Tax=Salinarimonas sp. TaxID=2766526 RepID=UPI0032D902DF